MNEPTTLTRDEEMQAYIDTLGALATAIAWQIDPVRFAGDLQAIAHAAEDAGHGPSAGLIDELARTVEIRVLGRKDH